MFDWKVFFNDFADRYYSVPHLDTKEHIYALQNYLLEQGMLVEDVDYAIKTLLGEAPDKPDDIDPDTPVKYTIKDKDGKDIQKTTTYANAIKRPKASPAYKAADALRSGDKSKEPTQKDKPVDAQMAGDRDAKPGDTMKKSDDGKVKDKKPSVRGVTSESIDSMDGNDKQKTMDGKEPPPGTESSAVAEIGVGYGMACLSENKNNMEAAEKCLVEKLSKSKLGKAHGTGDSKKAKDIRRGMLQTAKRENQKISRINKELGWKNSETSHIGGSKSSLKNTVDKLRERGITEVNGIPIDEYEEDILGI